MSFALTSIEKFIANRDDHAIHRAVICIGRQGWPSGKALQAWFEALFYELYEAHLAESEFQVPGVGSSAAKASSVESDTALISDTAVNKVTKGPARAQRYKAF